MIGSSDRLPTHYAVLDGLPASLHDAVVTHLHGELVPRANAILTLRKSLLGGRMPRDLSWPAPDLRLPILKGLHDAGVPLLCRGDAALTDEVLLFILGEAEYAHRLYERSLLAFLAMAELDARRGLESSDPGGESTLGSQALREHARNLAADLVREGLAHRTHETWAQRADALAELGPLFEELLRDCGQPGDGRGLLRELPPDDLLEMRRALAPVEPLRTLVRALGRGRAAEKEDAPTERLPLPRAVSRPTTREAPMSVQGSGEVRGVERTGEVARMLPSEAVLLTHPLLRGLWHAKRAERALLGYHAVGVMTSRIQTWTSQEELQEEETPADRGPIILILDTSGSMFGFRSTIAKAVALQVMAVAHAEERPCFGLNFSGPGDLLELELTFDGDGLTRLIRFVSSSFDGGTCPAEALAAASRRLHQGDWRKADIVLVSDGEWLPEPATMKRLARARRIHGVVRWHGVRVGGGPGFDALGCDTVHDVREWLP